MKLTECSDLKQLFLEKLKEKNSKPRPNVSVSDLVYCLREAYYKKTTPKPPTAKQLGFYTDGARRHEVLEVLSELRREVEVEKYGVKGHIDMLKDAPIEYKTTRMRKKLSEHYFLQLGFYATMTESSGGYLIVQRLMAEQDPWELYRVEWSEEEMLNFDCELYTRANLLRSALENKDPSTLPRVEEAMKWKCRNCLYQTECRKER